MLFTSIKKISKQFKTGDLVQNALSDVSRASIIRLLLFHHSLTLHEISQHLSLSQTATYHHISILKKANMLYDYLDSSRLFKGTAEKEHRSLMNVCFVTGDADLDKKFASDNKEQDNSCNNVRNST